MIFHVCSHFGDIEIEDAGNDQARVKFFRLTPMERDSLDKYLHSIGMERSGEKGEVIVPETVAQAGAALGWCLHEGQTMISAVKFSTGDVVATRSPFMAWFRGLMGRFCSKSKDEVTTDTAAPLPPPPPRPEAAVQTPMPARGCPMPTVTELREEKAAAVVRKFLHGQQVEDFDRHRAFVVRGGDTGSLYRVTTRWSPEVERHGVLWSIDRKMRICASNRVMPPSEEALSMKFAVEHFERDFVGIW